TRERALEGVEDRLAERDAARVSVLDDDARRRIKLGDHPAPGREVEDIRRGEPAPVKLLDAGQDVALGGALGIEGRPLVRVLPVDKVALLDERERDMARELLVPSEPRRDGGLVRGGRRERVSGEPFACGGRELAVPL